MKLFNTLTRRKEDLAPISPPAVGIYTCGPTVYNYLHIGNWRTYVFEDALVRTLRLFGYRPRRVMNITDVGHLTSQGDEGEDKMELGAAREGKTAWEIAKFYTDAFLAGSRELNLLPPDVLCRATDFIPEQIALVQRLEKKGLAYRISDGMYFDTAKLPDYGKLMSREHLEGQRSGARVEANPEKRSAADFALWKFSPQGAKRQMEWDSPWGRGFPGWHVECSAMAMRFLGDTFDIHCGGVDHIPVHHTNEIAQSEGATGKPFVKLWLHGEFLLMNKAKMAKSEGGFLTLSHLSERGFSPLDFRYHCFSAHYRKQLDFTWETLEASKISRRRLMEAAGPLKSAAAGKAPGAFRDALGDDLNVPEALAAVWDILKSRSSDADKRALLDEADSILALDLFKPAAAETIPAEIQSLLERRAQARAKKDFASADALRRELESRGWLVEDGKQGQKARRK